MEQNFINLYPEEIETFKKAKKITGEDYLEEDQESIRLDTMFTCITDLVNYYMELNDTYNSLLNKDEIEEEYEYGE